MLDVLIIGSGVAGYGVADWLNEKVVRNIAIISENRLYGTSRNSGSDKQTYYKLALDGQSKDSAYEMAKSIAVGGSCDGELAYIEAICSPKCFYRLVRYGVNFPEDEYGGFVGYKTDHDNARRATSVGPYTSRVMTERLEHKVLSLNKTLFLDNKKVVRIVTEGKKCLGVIAYDTRRKELIAIGAKNVVVCTGGCASVYENSVYPESQRGMTGVLINVGCRLANFQEWQYGLASTNFRWNVSGSYMQVVPRFVSIDSNGTENEFLRESFSDEEIFERTFLKGYEWPFDVDKSEKSSKIDLLVNAELQKGNRVFLDYTKNPIGYSESKLSSVCLEYLSKSNALANSPIERLMRLNAKAIFLYANNEIDILNEYLEIAVSAQHNNGGVWVDNNWQTSIDNLYAVGEVAGTFGIKRPGGSALNSTQVGGLRAATHIASCIESDNDNHLIPFEKASKKLAIDIYSQGKNTTNAMLGNIERDGITASTQENYIADENTITVEQLLGIALDQEKATMNSYKKGVANYKEIPRLMSVNCGITRSLEGAKDILAKIGDIKKVGVKAESYEDYLSAVDMLTAAETLAKIILEANPKTGSRGGALFTIKGVKVHEVMKYRKYITIYEGGKIKFARAKKLPKTDFWFEQIYNK